MNRNFVLGLLACAAVGTVGCSQEASLPTGPAIPGQAVVSEAAWIGPEGGTVEGNGCRVVIPAAGLAGSSLVVVNSVDGEFQLAPATLEITGQMEVWFAVSPSSSASVGGGVEVFDSISGQWNFQPGQREGDWIRIVVDGGNKAFRLTHTTLT